MANKVVAIDPGNEESALLYWCDDKIAFMEKSPNPQILALLRNANWKDTPLVVEQIKSYGMAVGQDVFDTCVWIGRFIEAFPGRHSLVPRKTVVTHHCNNPRGNDSNVRQALIDRFGGKDKAIGKKPSPGPLYEVKGDLWSALAIALWDIDTRITIDSTVD